MLLFGRLAMLARGLIAIFVVLAMFYGLVGGRGQWDLGSLIGRFLFFFGIEGSNFSGLGSTRVLFECVACGVADASGFAIKRNRNSASQIGLKGNVAFVLFPLL